MSKLRAVPRTRHPKDSFAYRMGWRGLSRGVKLKVDHVLDARESQDVGIDTTEPNDRRPNYEYEE